MGVEFTSRVILGDIDLREVTNTSDLDVVRGLNEVCPGDGAVWNQSCAMARLYAPCDLDTFGVTDDCVRSGGGGRENTPVIDCVDCSEA